MRFARVVYRVPGMQQHASRDLPNPHKVNMQPTFVEIVYDNQQQLLLPAANVVSVETFEKDDDEKEANVQKVKDTKRVPKPKT